MICHQTSVDISMAVIGYLLYGDKLKDELTKNMLDTEGYHKSIKVIVLVLIAILPLTKFPLQYVLPGSRLETITLMHLPAPPR